jgi:flagellar biosynthesis GTPase FlhF
MLSMLVSEKVTNSLVNITEECVMKAVRYCAEKYNFSAEEALKELGVVSVSSGLKKVTTGAKKVSINKPSFPLPYNGEMNEECCLGLRQNNGLYTQCTGARRKDGDFCNICAGQMQKNGTEVPEYGTINMRKAVGIFEYVDPKGRKPVAYAKVMKKYKLTEEQVIEEARKHNMTINPGHFVVPEVSKRGRPKTTEKEPKEKGTRGRPKKSKTVVEIAGESDDLFATLVANANEEVSEENEHEEEGSEEEEKAQEKVQEKAAKEAAKAQEKAAKEAAKSQEKAAKEAAKAQEKAAKEAEKAAKEAEKAAKEAEKAAKTQAKSKAKNVVNEKKQEELDEEEPDEEEPDIVKKICFEGKKYLKSKKTGIIYDFEEYIKNGEQVIVGKWNEHFNNIDFALSANTERTNDQDMQSRTRSSYRDL